MNLQQALENQSQQAVKVIPENIMATMQQATQKQMNEKLGANSIAVGNTFPEHTFMNVKFENLELKDLVGSNDYLVVSFYRGGWCPYCNLELKSLQSILPQLKEMKAQLVAITPERPDHSLTTVEKNELDFPVLTDLGSKFSENIGLAFTLAEELKPIYQNFGIDVQKHNGDFKLPIPATFVLDSKLKVLHKSVDVNYTTRLEPQEILNFIKNQ